MLHRLRIILLAALLPQAVLAQEPPADSGKRLEALLPGLSSADPAVVEKADGELERMALSAGRPGAEGERRAVASALAARLGPEVPAEARLLLLRHLQSIGRDESVPALARLLEAAQPLLEEAARRALEANPVPQAVRAIRKAYPAASGERRAALIQSLGIRRDALSVGELLLDARSDHEAVRWAALDALARIGDRAAIDVFEEALQAESPPKPRLAAAYLRLAESLSEGEEGGAARRIYLQFLKLGPVERSAGLIGLGRTGLPADLPHLLDGLLDPDPRQRGAALDGLAALRGATRGIGAKVESLPPHLRKDVIAVLGRRADPVALPFLLKAGADQDPGVRLAAIDALGATGGEGAFALLLSKIESGSEEERGAAERALVRLPEKGAGEAIATALEKAAGPTRVSLMRALGARGDPVRLPAGAEPALRAEYYRVLGQRGEAASLALLLEALRVEEGEALDSAAQALAGYRSAQATRGILEALKGAPDHRRASLLAALAGRESPEAAEALRAAAVDRDSRVRLAALEGLARSGDDAALHFLEEALRGSEAEARKVALRGLLRSAGRKAKEGRAESRDTAAGLYLRVLDQAADDEARKAALAGLGEVGGPDAITKIRPHLREGSLRREAGRAAVRLAARLPEGEKEAAVALLEEILQSDPDPGTARDCVRRLRRLGVERDLPRAAGMVTSWWLLGPIPDPGGTLLGTALPPERGVDLEREVKIGEAAYRWKAHHTADPRGAVDLWEALGGGEKVVAYLYSEVNLAEGAEALLKIGSDDGVACFLDGRKIHEHPQDRGLSLDQDVVKVELKKGPNRLLLKVANTAGGWEAALRITDPTGRPLPFRN